MNLIFLILLEESDTLNMKDITINHEGTNYLISNCPDRYFEKPSMQTFYNKIFMPKLPAMLTGKFNLSIKSIFISR